MKEVTEEMLKALSRLVSYDSTEAAAKPGKPFGDGPAAVLAEALDIAEEMGFRTKNLDNYCGYAEMGEGDTLIGIVAHLDVVPAGEGWDSDPFKMEVRDGKAYGRGVMDDKGPVISSLYAMKRVKDSGLALNKRVRLLMGCNEETGSACMEHYVKVEEPITYGFTPDAYYPGIYGEKGTCGFDIVSKNSKIVSMNGGFVSNAVCNRCTTVVKAEDVNEKALEQALKETPLKTFTLTEKGKNLEIYAEGQAAHASTPLLGINAAGYTMQALKAAGYEDSFVDYYNEKVGVKCDGEGLGLKLSDDYGELTFNNGLVKTENGVISCNVDIRYPVTLSPEDIENALKPYMHCDAADIENIHMSKPLFFEKDSDLVKALHKAYADVTKDTETEPLVIGGGTYAKHIPGIIAFGPEYMDVDSHIHDANECLDIGDFEQQVDIYTEAIKNLLAL